jgi:hypothetical protein
VEISVLLCLGLQVLDFIGFCILFQQTVQDHQKISGVGKAGIQNIGQIMTGVAQK